MTIPSIGESHSEERLQHEAQLLRLVLEAIPVGVVVLDTAGDIVLTNSASLRIWGGLVTLGIERYARSKGWWHGTERPVEAHEWASVRARQTGEVIANELIDIEGFDGTRKVIRNSAVPIRDDQETLVGAVVINEDVSARMTAERELKAAAKQAQTLAARLMQVQDDERRRIARMLHETTAQDLAALKMLLARLGRTSAGLSSDDRSLLEESVELAERAMGEVRTLSYLLHPPFLDESGLLSAIRWYAQGFGDRSGIEIDLDLPPAYERLPQDVEIALFRVLQEALINIHRHAQSPTARISLRVDPDRLTLDIEDRGVGMPPEQVTRSMSAAGAVGVGIPGMRERLKQLGGSFEITSGDGGTLVRAVLPLPVGAP